MNQIPISRIIAILRKETKQWKEPIVGTYKKDPFMVLISCILSLRTKDETTAKASEKLFSLAKTPREMFKLPISLTEETIYPVGFYRTKAKNIKKICKLLILLHDTKVPDEMEALLSLPGVGRKTANLVLTLGFKKPGICVDIHVHRISNRLGYIRTRTPDDTEMALRSKLPQEYWMDFNDLLVTYGQNLCKPVSPFCGRCKIRRYCKRAGVRSSR
ncbi:endonuclease III domain-containing protein [Elusimicrobiota bacterium]